MPTAWWFRNASLSATVVSLGNRRRIVHWLYRPDTGHRFSLDAARPHSVSRERAQGNCARRADWPIAPAIVSESSTLLAERRDW